MYEIQSLSEEELERDEKEVEEYPITTQNEEEFKQTSNERQPLIDVSSFQDVKQEEITSAKSVKSRKINIYQDRNRQFIQNILKQKQDELTKQEQARQKAQITKEKLKKAILHRVKKIKEQQQNKNLTTGGIPPKQTQQRSQSQSRRKTKNEVEKSELDTQKENENKTKLQNFYRSRIHSLLKTLKENREQKEKEQHLKEKKKQKMIAKLRENLGISKVGSKLLGHIQAANQLQEQQTNNELNSSGASNSGKKERPTSLPPINRRANTSDKPQLPTIEEKVKSKEAADKIVQRQMEFLQKIQEKKKMQQEQEQEKKNREQMLIQKARQIVLEDKEKVKEDPQVTYMRLTKHQKKSLVPYLTDLIQ